MARPRFLPRIDEKWSAGKGIGRQVDHAVVELRPRIVERRDVHCVVVVEEVKWKRKHTAGALILEVERRCAAEGREQRESREDTGHQMRSNQDSTPGKSALTPFF